MRYIGRRYIQFVFWPSPKEWALTLWRWPPRRTRDDAAKAGMTNFGFWGLCLGPLEIRYWPSFYNAPTGEEREHE